VTAGRVGGLALSGGLSACDEVRSEASPAVSRPGKRRFQGGIASRLRGYNRRIPSARRE